MASAVELLKRIQHKRNDKVHFYMDKGQIGYANMVETKSLAVKFDNLVAEAADEREKNPSKYGESRWDKVSR
jgi:hypothetical protein